VVKAFLAAGFPVVFGFPVPTSLTDEGDIPYRPMRDSYFGGQAAVAVGYDDERIRTSKGALLVRNSWGVAWGEAGYGWLPYGFLQEHLATDFWTVLRPDWIESGQFNRPRLPYSKSKPAVSQSIVERKLPPR
jgi:C1A family cysteine protease